RRGNALDVGGIAEVGVGSGLEGLDRQLDATLEEGKRVADREGAAELLLVLSRLGLPLLETLETFDVAQVVAFGDRHDDDLRLELAAELSHGFEILVRTDAG